MAGFRLHPIEDADIIKDLSRFTNKTNRIKENYRKAMLLENGVSPVQQVSLVGIAKEPTVVKKPETWIIPEEPSVKKVPQESLKAKILFKNNF